MSVNYLLALDFRLAVRLETRDNKRGQDLTLLETNQKLIYENTLSSSSSSSSSLRVYDL